MRRGLPASFLGRSAGAHHILRAVVLVLVLVLVF